MGFSIDRSVGACFNDLFGCARCRKQQPCLHLLLAWCQIYPDCAAARILRDNLLYRKGQPAEKVSVQIFMHPDPLQLGYALAEEWLYWYGQERSLGVTQDRQVVALGQRHSALREARSCGYWDSAVCCLHLLPQIHLRRILWRMGAYRPDTEQSRYYDDIAAWVHSTGDKQPDGINSILDRLRPAPRNLFLCLAYATLTWLYADKLSAWQKLVQRLRTSDLIDKCHLSCFDHPAPKSWLKVGVTPYHWEVDRPIRTDQQP